MLPNNLKNARTFEDRVRRALSSPVITAAMLGMVLLLSALFSSLLSGCGNGSTSFDGGHIPIGGNSAVSAIVGLAFAAENTTEPVANATVLVTNTALAGPTRTQTAVTGKDGSFKFLDVPNPYAVSRMTIMVTPAASSDRAPQQLSFALQPGQTANVMVAMPSVSFDQTQPAAVTVAQLSAISAGDSARVNASVLTAAGTALAVQPSLVFIGSFGTITPDGIFTSTTTGSGVVTAYWDTGSSLLSGSTAVTVNTQTIHKPPPPPVVPVSGG
jgi:hypothetical protein